MVYGHQSFGFGNLNPGNCAASKRAVLLSPAASSTACFTIFLSTSATNVPLTGTVESFRRSAEIFRSAAERSSFNRDVTNGLRTATGPLAVIVTSFHI